MRSLTIRTINRFDIDENLPILKNGNPVGSISPTGRTFIMEGITFNVYSCSYFVSFNETIMVRTPEEDTYFTVDSYQKSENFELYTIPNRNLLFVDAPTGTSKTFLTALTQQYPDKIDTEIYCFDFPVIGQYQNNAKAIYFSVDDDAIDNKIFFGNGVDQDDEAVQAIDNENATYLMVEIDLRQRARTIGFSKKGAIVIYNIPNDLEGFENPYLQLAYDAIMMLAN